jgi:hypothetical protein
MEIEIHPEARKALEGEATRILAIADRIYTTQATPAESFLVIGGMPVRVDVMWENVAVVGGRNNDATAVAIAVSGQMVQFIGGDFLEFSRFAERVQDRAEFRNLVSIAATREVLARWIQLRLQVTMKREFMEFYLEWVRNNVAEQTIVLPIYDVVFDGALEVHGVRIRNLSAQEFRDWYTRRPELNGDNAADPEFLDWNREIADRAAAFVTLLAEPQRAEEIAFERVDRVLSILRSYSPAMLSPEARSFCTIYGMEHRESRLVISIPLSGPMRLRQEPLGGGTRWHLDGKALQDLVNMAFYETCELLELASPTEFQSRVARSIELYSLAALEHRLESKLLFILSAIEHLLLMDYNEPIAANLARRFAYYVGETLVIRRTIQRRIKEIYTKRSNFVHHGSSIDDLLLVKAFLRDAWSFFRRVAHEANRYPSKVSFLTSMEDEMLAGPLLELDASSPTE